MLNLKKLAVALISSLAVAVSFAEVARPNVLIVIADDLGYTDIGAFGSEISTPTLDSIANSSIKLTNFYTAPTCSLTRSMLFTGVDNHKVGLANMAEALQPNQRGKPGYEGYLTERAAFLPKSFKESGYRTMMTGKWHLGFAKEQRPFARGFDQTWVLLDGGASHLDDMGPDGRHPKASFSANGIDANIPSDFYSSEFYTDKMIDFIGGQQDKPFFAVLSYTAPHWPLMAPQSSIDKYHGKYDAGYEVFQQQRLAKAKALGVVSEKATELASLPGLKAWDQLDENERKREVRAAEIYAAMIDDMDVSLGRLIAHLKATNQFENTVIFFMSDNGVEGATLEREMSMLQGHVKNCCDQSYENMGKVNSFNMLGPQWARAFVGGNRDYKGRVTEGGIHVPAFMKLPGDSVGTNSHQFMHVRDVIPTLMDIVGIELPSHAELAVEGRSYFESANKAIEQGWNFMGGVAYRKGDWKAIRDARSMFNPNWHLFNLAEDPSEQNDVASEYPEVLAELVAAFALYEKDNGIIHPEFPPRKPMADKGHQH